ncbi:hypothetical protein P4O66_012586, partial [Electrophorus voltai]
PPNQQLLSSSQWTLHPEEPPPHAPPPPPPPPPHGDLSSSIASIPPFEPVSSPLAASTINPPPNFTLLCYNRQPAFKLFTARKHRRERRIKGVREVGVGGEHATEGKKCAPATRSSTKRVLVRRFPRRQRRQSQWEGLSHALERQEGGGSVSAVPDSKHPTGGAEKRSEKRKRDTARDRRKRRRRRRATRGEHEKAAAATISHLPSSQVSFSPLPSPRASTQRLSDPRQATMSHCRKRCKRQLTKVARYFYRFLTGTLTQ